MIIDKTKKERGISMKVGTQVKYYNRDYVMVTTPELDGEYYVGLAKSKESAGLFKIFWQKSAYESYKNPYVYAVL